jgi:ribonuclease P protein component
VFKKSRRLARKKDIAQVLESGKKVFGRSLILFFLKNDLGYLRATVIVGTKINKAAVDRNKIKRRIRAILKNHENMNYDLAVLALKQIKNLGFKEIKNDLEQTLDRIKAW